MIEHELDIYDNFFTEILYGRKKHEIRRVKKVPFQEGDILILNEKGLFSKEFSGRKLKAKITYISPIEVGEVYKMAVMSFYIISSEGI